MGPCRCCRKQTERPTQARDWASMSAPSSSKSPEDSGMCRINSYNKDANHYYKTMYIGYIHSASLKFRSVIMCIVEIRERDKYLIKHESDVASSLSSTAPSPARTATRPASSNTASAMRSASLSRRRFCVLWRREKGKTMTNLNSRPVRRAQESCDQFAKGDAAGAFPQWIAS